MSPAKSYRTTWLPVSREVVVSTATGEYVTNIYNNALVKILGRSAIVEVIELHDNATPLLGVIPMEILGLEVDVVKHELRLLPLRFQTGPICLLINFNVIEVREFILAFS